MSCTLIRYRILDTNSNNLLQINTRFRYKSALSSKSPELHPEINRTASTKPFSLGFEVRGVGLHAATMLGNVCEPQSWRRDHKQQRTNATTTRAKCERATERKNSHGPTSSQRTKPWHLFGSDASKNYPVIIPTEKTIPLESKPPESTSAIYLPVTATLKWMPRFLVVMLSLFGCVKPER